MAQICKKWFLGWGFASDPTGGTSSTPPNVAVLGRGGPQGKGKTKGREGKEGKEGKKSDGRGRRRKLMEEERTVMGTKSCN